MYIYPMKHGVIYPMSCFVFSRLHPWKLTWNLKMKLWKRRFLLQTHHFQVPAVSFRGPFFPTETPLAVSGAYRHQVDLAMAHHPVTKNIWRSSPGARAGCGWHHEYPTAWPDEWKFSQWKSWVPQKVKWTPVHSIPCFQKDNLWSSSSSTHDHDHHHDHHHHQQHHRHLPPHHLGPLTKSLNQRSWSRHSESQKGCAPNIPLILPFILTCISCMYEVSNELNGWRVHLWRNQLSKVAFAGWLNQPIWTILL